MGLTATPIRSDNKGLGGVYEELVEAGNIKSLTEKGYLVKNRIIAPSIPDLQGVRIIAGDYDKGQLEKKMNRPKLVGDIVANWVKSGENRPSVVFATSIKHSKYICNVFNHNGVPAGHIDGEMPEIEREKVLNQLDNDEIKVISNCMVLTEGWDKPKISCVIIARPTKSYGMWIQMVGRSLRPYPNKTDTIILDHSGAIYEHGFPEDAGNWSLKTTTRKEKEKITKEKVEKQPLTCTECFSVYKPTKDDYTCPNCAFIPTKKERIVLIDIDPEITKVCSNNPEIVQLNQGSLLNNKVAIINQDAYKFVEWGHHNHNFDVVIIDLPDPNHESLSKLYSVTFYKLIENILNTKGVIVTQSTSPFFSRDAFWCIHHTIEKAGLHTYAYHLEIPSMGDWGFNLASKTTHEIKNIRLSVETNFLTNNLIQAMFQFGKDVNELETKINTLLKPILMFYYEDQNWRHY